MRKCIQCRILRSKIKELKATYARETQNLEFEYKNKISKLQDMITLLKDRLYKAHLRVDE